MKKFSWPTWTLFILLLFSAEMVFPQDKQTDEDKHPLDELNLSGLKFREIGPALTSGRISDFAINNDEPHKYYVAVSSGGVWKTVNSGTTYTPVFDSEGSYSIGCITMDPSNPNTVWVGTGENNNQRSVAYGDGVYKSVDGGASWKNMGLNESEHIAKIIVHPDNSDIVYVAAIGPLWKKGGERGVYKSTDGGESWENVLTIDEYTGVTDLVMDPRNPDVLYAAAFQRARHVFTYLGGGPGSALYKTSDGGATWEKANKGLPSVDLGRIGLAISPADPEIIYAIVEAADDKGGFYRSTNRGASWEKRGSFVTRGNYYQEIIADPVDPETVYAMDTWMKVSHDGGKSFQNVGEDYKHVDNHCMWINPENNKHWLVGCDGGIYETWDAAKTWDFKANLPVTQFYKVAVDNDEPFYNIYGGTQDNFSLGAPSRTITSHGIVNSDWIITHGGDGFESQVDPENPDIIYAQSQYGVLVRYDRKSGEEVGIQPKERKGENAYRWNWDAPLAVSEHHPGRVYFAANKVFRSDDYGNSWEVISPDLTRQINRNELEIMDRLWSIDAVAKNESTSPFGTIVAFSESPLNDQMLAAGTDDGLIRITTDGGQNWKKVDQIDGIPERSYVNTVLTSRHDENVIYAAFNHHKYGDFKPYVVKSEDQGNSWEMISNNLPERGSVYALAEDHVDSELLFAGTEFGVFFSPDGGMRWKQLKSGVPTIAVRDIAIQQRENDLVLGTFGRGFFVLDDYSALREITAEGFGDEAMLFSTRDAFMFEKSQPLGLPGKAFQGDSFYSGENLGPVAVFTYYYGKETKSMKEQRLEREKELSKEGKDNAYPTYEELLAESEEYPPKLVFTIRDPDGNVIQKLEKNPSKGISRIEWNLRHESQSPIRLSEPSFYNPFSSPDEGSLVRPGEYSVIMHENVNGKLQPIGGPVTFVVKPLENTVMPAEDREEKVEFQREVEALAADIESTQRRISEMNNQIRHIKEAIKKAESPLAGLLGDVRQIDLKLSKIQRDLNGNSVASRLDIELPPAPASRIGWIQYEQKYSTSTPTRTHRDSYQIAKEEYIPVKEAFIQLLNNDFKQLEEKLLDIGAPYTPGRMIEPGVKEH